MSKIYISFLEHVKIISAAHYSLMREKEQKNLKSTCKKSKENNGGAELQLFTKFYLIIKCAPLASAGNLDLHDLM